MTVSVVAWWRAAPAEPSREALSSTSTSERNGSASRSAAIASRQRTSSSRCSVLTTQKDSSTSDTAQPRYLATRENPDMDDEARLRGMYDAFNARDIDAVLAAMTDDVDWPNAWEGGRVRARPGGGPRVLDAPVGRDRPERRGSPACASRPTAPSPWTSTRSSATSTARLVAQGTVVHVYTLRDELVARMDIEEGDAGHLAWRARCASTSSTHPPTRRPTTTR